MDNQNHAADLDKTVVDYDIDFSRLLAVVYQDLYSQISLADSKAQLVMGAAAIVLAALVSNIGQINRLTQIGRLSSLVDILLMIGALLLLFASVYFAISATIPKISPMTQSKNLFFFGHIAVMDVNEYQEQFLKLTGREFKIAYLAQIHARSRIVQRKFFQVRLALICLTASFLLWVLAQIIFSLA